MAAIFEITKLVTGSSDQARSKCSTGRDIRGSKADKSVEEIALMKDAK